MEECQTALFLSFLCGFLTLIISPVPCDCLRSVCARLRVCVELVRAPARPLSRWTGNRWLLCIGSGVYRGTCPGANSRTPSGHVSDQYRDWNFARVSLEFRDCAHRA